MISIGLADSINPSTLATALVLSSGERAREHVARFTLGVFGVYFIGGLLITVGPGEAIRRLAPHPGRTVSYTLEVVAGAMLLIAGTLLWRHRVRLRQKQIPTPTPSAHSSWLLGATITLFELPTAFPYFGALAAIVGSGKPLYKQIVLLALFNVCFVAPLVAILLTLTFAGPRAQVYIGKVRNYLQRHWPLVLAVVALTVGGFVIALGVTGLLGRTHGRFGSLARKLHSLLPH